MPLHTTENSFTVCCAPAMSRSTTYKTISHTVRAQGFNKCLSKHGRCVADARKKHMCSVSCYCISEWDEHFQNGRTVILLQPCFASARARCRPMPDPAPVIRAALPPTFMMQHRTKVSATALGQYCTLVKSSRLGRAASNETLTFCMPRWHGSQTDY